MDFEAYDAMVLEQGTKAKELATNNRMSSRVRRTNTASLAGMAMDDKPAYCRHDFFAVEIF